MTSHLEFIDETVLANWTNWRGGWTWRSLDSTINPWDEFVSLEILVIAVTTCTHLREEIVFCAHYSNQSPSSSVPEPCGAICSWSTWRLNVRSCRFSRGTCFSQSHSNQFVYQDVCYQWRYKSKWRLNLYIDRSATRPWLCLLRGRWGYVEFYRLQMFRSTELHEIISIVGAHSIVSHILSTPLVRR